MNKINQQTAKTGLNISQRHYIPGLCSHLHIYEINDVEQK